MLKEEERMLGHEEKCSVALKLKVFIQFLNIIIHYLNSLQTSSKLLDPQYPHNPGPQKDFLQHFTTETFFTKI